MKKNKSLFESMNIDNKNNKYNLYDTFHLNNDAFELLSELCINKPSELGSIVDNQIKYINNLK